MQGFYSVTRWVGAVGIVLAPLCVFLIPQLMYPQEFETPADQFRAIADGSTGGYAGQVMQICGAVALIAAALGIGGLTIARHRGRTLGIIGLATGAVAAISILVVLGFETAVAVVLISSTMDTDAAVALAVELYSSPAFTIPLLVGLGGFMAALIVLALALWRSRVVPIVVPLLFLLPLLVTFIPLPASAAAMVPNLLILVPCLWISVQLIRGRQRSAESLTAVPTAASKNAVGS